MVILMATMEKMIKFVPLPVRKMLKPAYCQIWDMIDTLLSRRDDLIPPRKMIFIGYGDFKRVGDEFLQYFISLCNIRPDGRILDVGCGIGRMAIPLTKYINGSGSYVGFDIVNSGIQWCCENISQKYPHFQFQLADIYNKFYNSNGIYISSEYKFPFPNEDFDFVFATSVFTHMLSSDVENYLSEISRVLRKNGTFLITSFIINSESLNLIDQNKSNLNFKFNIDCNSMTINKEIPENAIAYNESFIRNAFERHNLA